MTRRVVPYVSLRLPPPISTNAIWRAFGNRNIKSAKYRTWQKEAGWMLAAQNPGRIDGAYEMTVIVAKKCKADLDNCVKAYSDLAQTHGVISNDRLCKKLIVTRGDEAESLIVFTASNQ